MAAEFVAVFVDLFSAERAALAAAELFVVEVALVPVAFFARPAFWLRAGVAPFAAAECLVDAFAVLLFLSFVWMAIGLRAFVIAFDRS